MNPTDIATVPREVDGWRLSRHARVRMAEMGVTLAEVQACLSPSAVQVRSTTYPGCMNRWHGRIALATNPAERSIITMLWNRQPDAPRFSRTDDPPSRP